MKVKQQCLRSRKTVPTVSSFRKNANLDHRELFWLGSLGRLDKASVDKNRSNPPTLPEGPTPGQSLERWLKRTYRTRTRVAQGARPHVRA